MPLPPLPMRVAYVVSHGLPYSSNGYAVRSHAVACALAELGHDVMVISKPGRPWSIEGFDPARTIPLDQRIDGVRYVFLPLGATADASLRTRLRAAENQLADAFEVFRPGVVIGASNWENAEPAQNAARRYGAAFFYEQRGFWDMGRHADAPTPSEEDQIKATRSREYETRIARDARAVFTLNTAMKNEMVARGVPGDKIHLMPNGVSLPRHVDPKITRDGLEITARHVLGYVGSLSEYEGLETLVQATATLRARGIDAAALIVGSAAPKGLVGGSTDDTGHLRALAAKLGISDYLHFVPQQPQSRIGSYYALLDAFVMPRRRSEMTQIVAPIKPYSAASYGVPVLMTDMPPLDEVAQEIGARVFPEADTEALVGLLEDIFANAPDTRPATSTIPKVRPALHWSHRVRPLSRLLQGEAQSLQTEQLRQGIHGSATGSEGSANAGTGGFDTARLPQVMLGQQRGTLAYLGPQTAQPDPRYDTDRRVQLTRANILSELATREPGVFVIDWPALCTQHSDAWDGLWSIHDMRLNRLIMDATRIAQQRGWQCHVIGPVQRSAAPLFRTVAQVFEEITP